MASIFIGIGGTGDWILTYLKEKVRAAFGEVPADIQFRLLDTLALDQRNNTAARLGNKVGIGPTEYLQLADQPTGTFYRLANEVAEQPAAKPHLSRWFKADLFVKHLPEADFNLVLGAGQHRQFGRMGMFLNKQQVMNMVRKALDDCGARDAGQTSIWIVGSVAGGTGAGTFPDMALLAREAGRGSGAKRILGVAVLPSVFGEVLGERDSTYRYDVARAYAVIREIARFQSPVDPKDRGWDSNIGKSFRFAVQYDEATRVLQENSLFDSLVFYDHPCANENDRRSYFSQIADSLSLTLDPAVGNKLFASWINAEEGYAATFNSHRVFLPARLYEHLFKAEAMLEIVDGLLPLDEHGAPKAGSLDDRKQEAAEMLETQVGPLFNRLARLREKADLQQLDQSLNDPKFIIDNLLGFGNPEAAYGSDATPVLKEQAQKLCRALTEGIARFGDPDNPDGYEDSKQSVVRDVVRRRRQYEGDGVNSFQEALNVVRPVVRKHLEEQLDEALATNLRGYPPTSEGLGRVVIFRNEVGQWLNEYRERALVLNEKHRARLQTRQGQEADARVEMEKVKKPFFGKGELSQRQRGYFDAVDLVQAQWQRGQLLTLVEELISVAQDRLNHWQQSSAEWRKALDGVRQEAASAIGDIHEELTRHTQTIQSSSLGITNRPDMDGYQAELRKRCVVDPQTGTPLPTLLLGGLEWRRDDADRLRLYGWPGRDGLAPSELYQVLNDFLEIAIAENMRRHEGMAKYLEWLRDVKQGSDLGELGNRLVRATQDFADRRPITETRRFLLLHGDQWNPRLNQGADAFLSVFNQLNTDSNIRHDRLEHNLRDADGRILFKDKNVIAFLVTDNRIDYPHIPVMNTMREHYLEVRAEAEASLPWRTQAYHLFRCEQEAWEIERRIVRQGNPKDLPSLPGEYCRVLDEPERVALFARALVAGIVRMIEVGIMEKEWICAPLDSTQPTYLTEGGGDLFRALATFVQDKKDRRKMMAGDLRPEVVKGWVLEAAAGKSWSELVQEFRVERADWFEPGDILGEVYADPRRAFLARVLDYYLRED